MADYFTETSFKVPIGSDDEKEWWESVVDAFSEIDIDTIGGDNDFTPNFPCGVEEVLREWGINWRESCFPIVAIVESYVLFRSEGYLDVETTAAVLQAFLRRFRPNACLGFTYSETCSKPRIGAFSGGAVYVDAKTSSFMNGWCWLIDQLKEASEGGAETIETGEG